MAQENRFKMEVGVSDLRGGVSHMNETCAARPAPDWGKSVLSECVWRTCLKHLVCRHSVNANKSQ